MVKAPSALRSEGFDLKKHEMNLRLFTPEKIAEVRRREMEIEAGRFEGLSSADELLKRKVRKGGRKDGD
jgi:hypothetical protein